MVKQQRQEEETRRAAGKRATSPCAHCRVYGTVRRGVSSEGLPLVTKCEVARHDVSGDCWIVCRDKCFDVSDFLDAHPGGRRSLLRRAGGVTDTWEDFAFHSASARKRWSDFAVAALTPCASSPLLPSSPDTHSHSHSHHSAGGGGGYSGYGDRDAFPHVSHTDEGASSCLIS